MEGKYTPIASKEGFCLPLRIGNPEPRTSKGALLINDHLRYVGQLLFEFWCGSTGDYLICLGRRKVL